MTYVSLYLTYKELRRTFFFRKNMVHIKERFNVIPYLKGIETIYSPLNYQLFYRPYFVIPYP